MSNKKSLCQNEPCPTAANDSTLTKQNIVGPSSWAGRRGYRATPLPPPPPTGNQFLIHVTRLEK